MGQIKIPCDVGEISDGYHTFNELYEHRCLLFIAMMKLRPKDSWVAKMHADGGMFDGWFVTGMDCGGKTITYHMPMRMLDLVAHTSADILEYAPEYDGHTSNDVLERLKDWIRTAP